MCMARFYYGAIRPADCIKPLYVDDNTTRFYNDRDYIITSSPAKKLYYVYHNRNLGYALFNAPEVLADGQVVLRAPETEEELLAARQAYEFRDNAADDFPEWDYTPYDADFWEYFSYRLAARLIPRLRADDGAGSRAQAMEALAARVGGEAVKRSSSAAVSPEPKELYWHERLGLSVTYGDYRRYRAWK